MPLCPCLYISWESWVQLTKKTKQNKKLARASLSKRWSYWLTWRKSPEAIGFTWLSLRAPLSLSISWLCSAALGFSLRQTHSMRQQLAPRSSQLLAFAASLPKKWKPWLAAPPDAGGAITVKLRGSHQKKGKERKSKNSTSSALSA